MTKNFRNHFPRLVEFGRNKISSLSALVSERGWNRPFLVSDRGVERAGLLNRIEGESGIAKGCGGLFVDIPPEPPLETVDELATRIIDYQADVIVGLGGGSVMDAVKVASVCAHCRVPARSIVGIGKVGSRGLPTVLVPTTAGTGSEATFVAILTDQSSGNKVGVVDPCLLPDIAIVDPSLTDCLPYHVTASTGMDALVHAIEAYIALVATPVARGLALEAARRIGRGLERACAEGSDKEARDEMAIGSHLAGMAFANSSCCAIHALALPLGGRYAIPHGAITGCFAGEMMRHNLNACRDDLADLSDSLGWGRCDVASFPDRLDRLAESLGLQTQLKQVAIPDNVIDEMARDAVANRRLVDPNPVSVDQAAAARIYRAVLQR
jgi:alcohol dehydrogenase class IV